MTLDACRRAHEALLDAIDALDRLAEEDEPDEPRLTSARYRLSRLSTERRQLVARLCAQLLLQLAEQEAAQLRAFQKRQEQVLTQSLDHVHSWSMREILSDWDGYRMASGRMRQSLRDQVAEERALLYPLLGR